MATDEDAVSDVIDIYKGVWSRTACRWRDSSTYTRGQKQLLHHPFCHSVCLGPGTKSDGSRLRLSSCHVSVRCPA